MSELTDVMLYNLARIVRESPTGSATGLDLAGLEWADAAMQHGTDVADALTRSIPWQWSWRRGPNPLEDTRVGTIGGLPYDDCGVFDIYGNEYIGLFAIPETPPATVGYGWLVFIALVLWVLASSLEFQTITTGG